MKKILFLLPLLYFGSIYGQVNFDWKNGYDYTIMGSDPYRVDAKTTTDGGLILLGGEESTPGENYNVSKLIKLSSSGATEWSVYIDSPNRDKKVIQTSDGGYMMVGEIFDGNTERRVVWIAKISTNGTVIWTHTYFESNATAGVDIQELSGNNGYIILAESSVNEPSGNSNITVLRVGPTGTLVWQKDYGNVTYDDTPTSIVQLADGNFIFSGETYTPSTLEDIWVVKIDPSGNIIWGKTYGGARGEYGGYLTKTPDGNIAFAATTNSIDGDLTSRTLFDTGDPGQEGWDTDVWVVKVNATDGATLSNKNYGGSGEDAAFSIGINNLGNIIFPAATSSNDNDVVNPTNANHLKGNANSDAWLVILNSDGTIAWQKGIGSMTDDKGLYFAQNTTGAYYAFGTYYYNDGDWVGLLDAGGEPPNFFVAKLGNISLPVTFQSIYAFISNGNLTVNWTSGKEVDNNYYMVQASTDGKTFKNISDKIYSKAQNGNSENTLDYSFSTTSSSAMAVIGVGLLAFGSIGYSRKTRVLCTMLFLIGGTLFLMGCSKNDLIHHQSNSKVFVRVLQVDKDGIQRISKTIVADMK